MKSLLALIALLASPVISATHIVDQKTFDAIANEFSGDRAQEHIGRIVEYHRIQGSPMMAEVAEKVVLATLKSAGVEARIEQYPSDGRTFYGSYRSPIGWSIKDGELWIEGAEPQRLCRFSDIPMCVSTYSKGGTWSGELIDVGPGTKARDYDGREVRGKVVLASGYAADVVREAVVKRGAVGAVIYPRADDRPDHPDMIRYNGLWTRAEEVDKSSGSFQLSANQYAELKRRMARGAVRVRGSIDATLGAGQLTLVHAYIRGTETPNDEMLIITHLDHPKWSANDNASGAAATIEIARTLQSLINAKKLAAPRRTIHFLWVPEFYGTMAWLMNHKDVRACTNGHDPRGTVSGNGCILAALNLDMVGEDTVKTNGRFYMTRAPLSVPSFLDALLPDLLEQTREAGLYAPSGTRNYWPAAMRPYSQGSDHDMLLSIGIPATMFGHDPDWTHHTSEDRIDKTDASELLRVGVLAANAAYWVAAADDAAWQRLAPAVAAERLRANTEMLVDARRRGNTRLASELQKRVANDVTLLERGTLSPRGTFVFAEPKSVKNTRPAARATSITPAFGETIDDVTGADLAWVDQQKGKLADFDVALTEAVNFMNGSRSSAEIADLLSMELGEDVDEAWVERLTQILMGLKLVAR